MDDESSRFGDDREPAVLVHELDRKVLGLGARLRRSRDLDPDPLSAAQLFRRPRRSAVDRDAALLDQPLNASAAERQAESR
jgi:hypothetical protein